MTAQVRRERLLTWLRARVTHNDLTANEIVNVSGLYDLQQHYRYDRCFDDLKALEKAGKVSRHGRPARWWS